MMLGVFPFGSPLRPVVQQDRGPRRVFVLGVYASAVHARWVSHEGKTLVHALAVASEPEIFWRGDGAEHLVTDISLPEGAGHLHPAAPQFNGPAGRSLDEDFLAQLGVTRGDAWLCDLLPHACLNRGQQAAIEREYEPRQRALRLPSVTVPRVPTTFADDARRAEILDEIEQADAEVVVLLGDQPIRQFLAVFDDRWGRLADFGLDDASYGRLHDVTLGGTRRRLLPLAHPRQAAALGRHSARWRELHAGWARKVAGTLLDGEHR